MLYQGNYISISVIVVLTMVWQTERRLLHILILTHTEQTIVGRSHWTASQTAMQTVWAWIVVRVAVAVAAPRPLHCPIKCASQTRVWKALEMMPQRRNSYLPSALSLVCYDACNKAVILKNIIHQVVPVSLDLYPDSLQYLLSSVKLWEGNRKLGTF